LKILVLCDQGNNRSVTIAHHLKYWGHDILSAGISTNTQKTLDGLVEWADRVITTEKGQELKWHGTQYEDKFQLWNVGPDTYPRPFNRELLGKVRALMENHKAEYKGK
jgi:predicted protein tyrosine phosphatase